MHIWTTCFRNQHSIGWATQLTALHCSDCISGGLPRPISRLWPLRFVTCLIIASAVYLHSLTGAHVINVKEKCCDNCQVKSRDIVPTETKIVHQVHELYAGVDIKRNILIFQKACFPSQKSWTPWHVIYSTMGPTERAGENPSKSGENTKKRKTLNPLMPQYS